MTQNWGMGSTIGVILIIAMFLVMLLTGEKKKEDNENEKFRWSNLYLVVVFILLYVPIFYLIFIPSMMAVQ